MDTKSKPGSHSFSEVVAASLDNSMRNEVGPSITTKAFQLEQDILSKQKTNNVNNANIVKARSRNASRIGHSGEDRSSIRRENERMQDLVSVKIQNESVKSKMTQPSNLGVRVKSRPDLATLDERIEAKMASAGPTGTSFKKGGSSGIGILLPEQAVSRASSGTSRTSMQSMESDALAKYNATAPYREPVCSASSGHDSFDSKQSQDKASSDHSRASSHLDLRQLDNRISSKVASLKPSKGVSTAATKKNRSNDMIENSEMSSSKKPGTLEELIVQQRKTYNGKEKTITERPNDLESGDIYVGTEQSPGLAVATPVDDDDDKFIPAAVEFDPDAKPPLSKNRRFRLYSALAFTVVSVIVVGAIIGFMLNNGNNNENENSEEPVIPYRETLGIKDQIEKVVGNDKLEDPVSPYLQALEWITHEDPMQITPDERNFIQRYTAAYFYYATSVERPWASCGKAIVVNNETEDCVFVKLVQADTGVASELPSLRWLSNATECEWAGVLCDENEMIHTIDLAGGNLTGTFPEGIQHFSFLQILNLAFSELTGTLPSEIGTLKHLISFEVQGNYMNGTLPDELWNMRSLQRLNLGMNMFSGSLPTSIGGLFDIKGLFLFQNSFTGSIPDEFSELKSLEYLYLYENMISGTIPTTFGPSHALIEVMLQKNQLTGTIPSSLGEMPYVVELRLQYNNLTGTIPDAVFNLTKIRRIDVSGNELNGTISPMIGQLSTLQVLRLKDNAFSGSIPVELGGLLQLEEVWLSGNNFTGEISTELCELRNTTNGLIEELEADCLISNMTDVAKISCPDDCCTYCCDPTAEICF